MLHCIRRRDAGRVEQLDREHVLRVLDCDALPKPSQKR
jgi:hypothetical protein